MFNGCLKSTHLVLKHGISFQNETRLSKVDSVETTQRCYKNPSPNSYRPEGGLMNNCRFVLISCIRAVAFVQPCTHCSIYYYYDGSFHTSKMLAAS